MKKNIVMFLKRGLLFSSLGPIIVGFVFWMIDLSTDFTITGGEIFLAIVSGWLLAFVHAGTSVFHQIDEWPVLKGALFQLVFLYVTYLVVYLINKWLPFDWRVILIFTAIFIVAYFIIWIIIYLIVRCQTKKLNQNLNKE